MQTETFSAHQMIYEKLKSNDILGNLSRLATAVKQKQDASVPTFECVANVTRPAAHGADHGPDHRRTLAARDIPLPSFLAELLRFACPSATPSPNPAATLGWRTSRIRRSHFPNCTLSSLKSRAE